MRGQGHTKRSNAPARIDLKVVLQPVLSKEASKAQIVPAPTIRFSESIEYRPMLAPTSITVGFEISGNQCQFGPFEKPLD